MRRLISSRCWTRFPVIPAFTSPPVSAAMDSASVRAQAGSMARLVQGKPPGYDLTRFRFSRFSDGSPIIPGPAV